MSAYKHSGELGPLGLVAPLLTTVAAIALSVAYAYINVWSPIAGYISLLFVAAFGFGLFSAVVLIGKLVKCRNATFMTAVGVWTGIVALYASWAFFVYALMSRYDETFQAGMLDVLVSPGAVWATILQINENGWYTIKSLTPTGVVLWAFWGIEALIVLGASALGGASALSGEVFCERCNSWCEDSDVTPRLRTPEGGADGLSTGNLSALEALAASAPEENPHLQVAIKQCGSCDKVAAAQLQRISFERDDDGKVSVQSDDLGEMHRLSNEEFDRMKQLAARAVQTPADDPVEEPAEAPAAQ